MGGIRQRLQLRYSGETPGDAPEPLTNYLDVSTHDNRETVCHWHNISKHSCIWAYYIALILIYIHVIRFSSKHEMVLLYRWVKFFVHFARSYVTPSPLEKILHATLVRHSSVLVSKCYLLNFLTIMEHLCMSSVVDTHIFFRAGIQAMIFDVVWKTKTACYIHVVLLKIWHH